MSESKQGRRRAAASAADAAPHTAPKRTRGKAAAGAKTNRGGAPRRNVNALRTGKHSKQQPEAWGKKGNEQKAATLAAWQNHCRNVKRQCTGLLADWGIAGNRGTKLLGQELARALLLLHRLDRKNLGSIGNRKGDIKDSVREQVAAAGVVVTMLGKLFDRAAEMHPASTAPAAPVQYLVTMGNTIVGTAPGEVGPLPAKLRRALERHGFEVVEVAEERQACFPPEGDTTTAPEPLEAPPPVEVPTPAADTERPASAEQQPEAVQSEPPSEPLPRNVREMRYPSRYADDPRAPWAKPERDFTKERF